MTHFDSPVLKQRLSEIGLFAGSDSVETLTIDKVANALLRHPDFPQILQKWFRRLPYGKKTAKSIEKYALSSCAFATALGFIDKTLYWAPTEIPRVVRILKNDTFYNTVMLHDDQVQEDVMLGLSRVMYFIVDPNTLGLTFSVGRTYRGKLVALYMMQLGELAKQTKSAFEVGITAKNYLVRLN